MTHREQAHHIQAAMDRRGISSTIGFDDVLSLVRAQSTLHRWAELECGDGNEYCSWSIERDENTGKPYRCVYPHASGTTHRYTTPDREAGALRRVAAICKRNGLHFYHQTDPRGCALYVSNEPLNSSNYTNGIAVVWG